MYACRIRVTCVSERISDRDGLRANLWSRRCEYMICTCTCTCVRDKDKTKTSLAMVRNVPILLVARDDSYVYAHLEHLQEFFQNLLSKLSFRESFEWKLFSISLSFPTALLYLICSLESHPYSPSLANMKSRIEDIYLWIFIWKTCWRLFFHQNVHSYKLEKI